MINALNTQKRKYLDKPENDKYFEELWNPDYGHGLYFSAFSEIGQDLLINILVNNVAYITPHALEDGFSILNRINNLESLGINIPQTKVKARPKGLKWFVYLYKCLFVDKTEGLVSLEPRKEIYDPEMADFFSIKIPANNFNTPDTSSVLNRVSKIISKFFIKNEISRWMVPVSLKGQAKAAPNSRLCSSYVGVNCANGDSTEDTRQKLTYKLKNREYWLYWLVAEMGLHLGKGFILYLTKKSFSSKRLSWLGNFSALGDLKGDGLDNDLVILSPVRYHRPIGVVFYKFNSIYHVVVSVHRSLVSDKKLELLRDEIRQSFTK